MDSVTSLPLTERTRVIDWSPFLEVLHTDTQASEFPLLVLRVCNLGDLAWRYGRRRAREQEERCTRRLEAAAQELLRAEDAIAHRDGTEWYVVALRTLTRSGVHAMPADARGTLARLEHALSTGETMHLETGWTIVEPLRGIDDLERHVETALERGRRERERYAFFSVVGHELRTPLTSIRGYLETVLEDDLDVATTRRFLETAYVETLRVGRLVEGLFDISLLDLRTRARHDEQCRVESAVAAALEATLGLRRKTGVTFVNHIEVDGNVSMLEGALTQILVNLIDNAVKYGRPSGTIILSGLIVDERMLELRVDDDGAGINLATSETLFSIGERGTSAKNGSGIGLALVRLFAERAGGEAGVGRSPAGGARFYIRLPLAKPVHATPK